MSIVVPTLGRPSLTVLLAALAPELAAPAPVSVELLLVDDRAGGDTSLPVPTELASVTRVVAGRAAGPAAARNLGWRAARHEWVAFLDDDVAPEPGWLAALLTDLTVPAQVGGVRGRVRVPLPAHRRPTDWERNTAGLATAAWITADMAYRRSALVAVGGFDERFPRAYREDAELAYRVAAAGWRLRVGRRWVNHPVRPERWWVSLRAQRGNADDARLRRIYGRRWRRLLAVPAGRRAAHVATTGVGVSALVSACAAAVSRRGRPHRVIVGWAAAAAAAGWFTATGQFALRRIRPGPRDPAEVGRLLLTSVVIPPLATVHWLRGWWPGRALPRWSARLGVQAG